MRFEKLGMEHRSKDYGSRLHTAAPPRIKLYNTVDIMTGNRLRFCAVTCKLICDEDFCLNFQIQCTCCLSLLTIVGCCLGLFAAFGFNRIFLYEYSNSIDNMLANVIGIGCILAVFLSFFSAYVSLKYMYFFDVERQRNDRNALAVNNRRVRPLPRAAQFRTTNRAIMDQINQLEAQNLLLQQQLILQGQLQQQLQQQMQTGFYPSPPPPSPSSRRPSPGISNRRMHQPRAPPPSYYDVKYT